MRVRKNQFNPVLSPIKVQMHANRLDFIMLKSEYSYLFLVC